MTIDFIPLEYYTLLYYNLLLVVVLFTWVNSTTTGLTNTNNLKKKNLIGLILLIFIIIYAGFRPISGRYFGDTSTYAYSFQQYVDGVRFFLDKDVAFDFFMFQASKVMTVNFFFFLVACIYVVPLYVASKKIFKDYWFYSFFILICSFSFWSYGTNGIRNGMATSLLLLALSYRNNKIVLIALMLLATAIHKSMLLPVLAYAITLFYTDSKKIFIFWLLCIPLSLLAGGSFEVFFGSLGFDDRTSYLTDGNVNNDNFSSMGFRWDFLLYSASAVYAGWYFIFKKNFKDPFYRQLFGIYLICNGFWILVIRANFSNRFAYLSWFMMGLVIVYPFLKKQFFRKQHKVLGLVILVYFMFTYFMNVIIYKK